MATIINGIIQPAISEDARPLVSHYNDYPKDNASNNFLFMSPGTFSRFLEIVGSDDENETWVKNKSGNNYDQLFDDFN